MATSLPPAPVVAEFTCVSVAPCGLCVVTTGAAVVWLGAEVAVVLVEEVAVVLTMPAVVATSAVVTMTGVGAGGPTTCAAVTACSELAATVEAGCPTIDPGAEMLEPGDVTFDSGDVTPTADTVGSAIVGTDHDGVWLRPDSDAAVWSGPMARFGARLATPLNPSTAEIAPAMTTALVTFTACVTNLRVRRRRLIVLPPLASVGPNRSTARSPREIDQARLTCPVSRPFTPKSVNGLYSGA